MIEFDNVTRTYARKVAVDGLTLTVPPGELFALLGPNGAGKTTTIRMVTGLLRPTAGAVRVCGCDLVHDVRRATQCIGYVPEEPFLYDKLSGREFLEFAAEMRGLDRPTRQRIIQRECRDFGLDDFIDNLTETYSHGMKQRLVFASALMHNPPVLVIDEPMVGLDPPSVRVAKDRLRMAARAGTTVLMSTHTLAIAEEIADRIGIMDHGRLYFLGTVSELQRGLASHHTSLESLFLELLQNGNGGDAKTEGGRKEQVDSRKSAVGGASKDSEFPIQAPKSEMPPLPSAFPLPPSSL
jgi:ABC-2 type transport system ATP-binding protein